MDALACVPNENHELEIVNEKIDDLYERLNDLSLLLHGSESQNDFSPPGLGDSGKEAAYEECISKLTKRIEEMHTEMNNQTEVHQDTVRKLYNSTLEVERLKTRIESSQNMLAQHKTLLSDTVAEQVCVEAIVRSLRVIQANKMQVPHEDKMVQLCMKSIEERRNTVNELVKILERVGKRIPGTYDRLLSFLQKDALSARGTVEHTVHDFVSAITAIKEKQDVQP